MKVPIKEVISGFQSSFGKTDFRLVFRTLFGGEPYLTFPFSCFVKESLPDRRISSFEYTYFITISFLQYASSVLTITYYLNKFNSGFATSETIKS